MGLRLLSHRSRLIKGAGIFVREEHLPAIHSNEHLALKAVYSRSLKSARALDANVDLYSDDSPDASYADLLARQDISAVVIALPIPSQPEYIKKALTAGKHVLAEKPIAKDIATATDLLQWYHSHSKELKGATLSIAEQFRYLKAFRYAGEQVEKLGKVLGFRVRMHAFVKPGSKYYETSWRKTPEYQGGFLLDGGVHFIAGIRVMLGKEKAARISAYTAQLQEHLPPVDTVDASIRLSNGSSGTFSVSFGTSFSGAEWAVACEGGSVSISGKVVTTKLKDGSEESVTIEDKGVKQEDDAWAESLVKGVQEAGQKPEEALADLEILEAMIKSGESDGVPIDLNLQI